VDFERAQRVLIERGREDDRNLTADQLEHLEAAQLRHLDVEEQQIGRELGHDLDRLEPVSALPHHLDVRMLAEKLPHDRARQRLVVDDHHA
jgi:hypothetical protein